MAINVPPVRGAGDLGHVDDSNVVREALLDLDTAAASAQGSADAALSAVGDHTHPGELPPSLPIAGGTMTGQILLPNGEPAAPSLAHAGDTDTGLYFPAADAVAIATGTTERMRIDSVGLITGSGTSLGAWTAYTPTLGGTGWAIGDGTAVGAYCRIGKLVVFRAQIVFGSTSTFGAAAEPTITGPLAALSGINGNQMLNARFLDTSTGADYLGLATTSASSPLTFLISYLGTNSQKTNITATAPFTWASNDRIQATGIYEAS